MVQPIQQLLKDQELGAVDSNTVFNIPVTSEATAKVGVDNIKVESSSENVKGTFLREQVELTGTDGQKHIAKLNKYIWSLGTSS